MSLIKSHGKPKCTPSDLKVYEEFVDPLDSSKTTWVFNMIEGDATVPSFICVVCGKLVPVAEMDEYGDIDIRGIDESDESPQLPE